MKDAIGKELEVGDKVVYVDGNRDGSFFSKAIINSFTPQMVRINKIWQGEVSEYKSIVYPFKTIKVDFEVSDESNT